MSKGFIFSMHYMENMLRFAFSMLPNLQKGIAVFRNEKEGGLNALLLEATQRQHNPGFLDESLEILNINPYQSYFSKKLEEKTDLMWLSTSDLPFIVTSTQRKIDVFSELENTILQIRFQSGDQSDPGLLYLFFNPRMANLGLAHAEKPLGADHKALIEQMVQRALYTYSSVLLHEQSVFDSISANTRNLINELVDTRSEIKKTREVFGTSILTLCEEYLNQFSIEKSIQAVYTPAARDKLSNYSGSISNLKQIISKAFVFALFVADNHQSTNRIAIDDWHLDLRAETVDIQDKTMSPSGIRNHKTFLLLDKLEGAAVNVLASRLPLTGDNVGKACPQPVSAPAISDSIKKHKIRIIQLLELHPDKWPIIRQQFKPITNILVPLSSETSSMTG
ncbi:MAG: hypothetical protein Q7J34_11130 [Bacteroidales bacterium]|nr:hypothetical protein [Bacteroidales bacterium]